MAAQGPRGGEAGTLAALQALLLTMDGIGDFLEDVAVLAAAAAADVGAGRVSCGITARYDDRPLTVASSDAAALQLDESQYGVDEGSCLQAMNTGRTVAVADADTDARWPGYLRAARSLGLRSSLSLPLIADGRSVGALNVYSRDRTDAFEGRARAGVEAFAAQASTALLLALRHVASSETTQQLETALRSRSVIDQAMGVIMAQQGCAADEAFAILRAHSQHNNRKLRVVAQQLVTDVGRGGRG